jgi:pilus assembly protein CpaC
VSDETVAQRAGKIAEAYSKNVVNVLTFGPKGAQEVLLEVKFAEVDRSALTQYGVNIFAPGLGNTIAVSQTGQFGAVNVTRNGTATSTTGNTSTTTPVVTPPTVNVTDFLNLFITRTDLNLGVVIKALQAKNLLQILAEPNLIAVNGKEASFTPVENFLFDRAAQSGFTAVTIQFKNSA